MTMDTSVRYFSSADAAAPALTGEAGSLIALLDACLLTGYGSVTLSALTQTDGTATATVDIGHGFHDYAVAEIAGAIPAEYNGTHRIRKISATQFTYEVPTGLAGSATGTITAELPSIPNWEKAFSATNKAAYRSTNAQATGLYLQVIDDASVHGGRVANVRGYEAMTDVDTGTNPFPTVAQQSGPRTGKSYTADATAVPWTLIGNGKCFYFISGMRNSPYLPSPWVFFFGDILSYKSNDAYHCALFATGSTASYAQGGPYVQNFMKWVNAKTTTHNDKHVARSYTQSPGAIQVGSVGDYAMTPTWFSGGGIPYPNPVDDGVYVVKARINENNALRGEMPGLFGSAHINPIPNGTIINGPIEMVDSRLLSFSGYTNGYSTAIENCGFLINMVGPWEL